MPYSSTSELPSSVRDKYSDKCQRAYMHAFNSVHDKTGDEGKAAASGHSAAQKCEGSKGMDTLGTTKFQIFSGILKANRSPDGRMRLRGIASSTTRDLHGDTMSQSAIEDMETAANNNLTIFLNHSYNVPEDVAGSVESARMKTRGVDATGMPNYDLDMDIVVNDANERAVKAFEAIERGTKLGLSIGAMIPEGGARQEKKGGPFVIDHVELLETSLVGIPANPRSWVEYAVKSLRDPTSMNGNNTYTVTTTSTPDVINATTWIETRDGDKITIGDDLDESPVLEEGVEPDITKNCPTCGKGVDATGCKDPYHKGDGGYKSAEPLIETDGSSTSDSITVDVSASQGAGSSTPGTEDGDYAASGEDDLDLIANTDGGPITLVTAIEKYASAVSELVTAKQTLADLRRDIETANRARDAAIADTAKVVTETQRVLNALADTPLMRRAVVVEAQQALSKRLSGIYSDAVLKIMEKE